MKQKLKLLFFRVYDAITVIFTLLYLPFVKLMKHYGLHTFPLNRSVFLRYGIYPIHDHYYEPQFRYSGTFHTDKIRNLRIDLNETEQLARLSDLGYKSELAFPLQPTGKGLGYYLENDAFGAGDADLYYLLIRKHKPRKIIEIGSGFSTLISLEAIQKNKEEGHHTELICIEPFEISWLEDLRGITLKREKVENVDLDFFSQLNAGDFLFIDSSHIIRPENDVLYEYLEILTVLHKGVFIHIHDIFTPRHYPKKWLQDENKFWNEQYLLEAFLYYNDSFKVLYSLNHLKHTCFEATQSVLVNMKGHSEPGSFWLEKIK